MKRLLLIVFLFSLVFGQDVLENKMPASNKIVVKLMFSNGSMIDPAGKEGLTAMTVSLMTRGGTENMTYAEIQDFLYPMAARYSGSVDKEVSIFSFEVHVDFLDKFYPVLKDILLNPAFDEKDFNRIKSNQQNYVDQVIRASSDEEYSKKALEDLLFRGTTYQHMSSGTSAGVSAINIDDIKNHYNTYFNKYNLLIGIAGNYSDAFLMDLKNDLANGLSDASIEFAEAPAANVPDGINVEIISKDGAFGSAIFTGFPIDLTRENDDFAALMVANSYLGEHRKAYGRLYNKIRFTRSMNYGDYSYIEWYNNGGRYMLPPSGTPRHSNYFSLWIRPVQIASQLRQQYPDKLGDLTVGHAHFALRLAIREVDLLIQNGMTQKSFDETRKFLQSYMKLYPSNTAQQLGYLMDSRYYGRKNYIEEMNGLLENLTLEDVNAAITKYWQVENMFITIVTDSSEANALAESIRLNSPSPMSYSDLVENGLSEDVKNEDDIVANYNLNINTVNVIPSADTFKTE